MGIQASPADDAIAALLLGSVSVTFDQPMYRGGPRHPAFVTNVANFVLVGAETGNLAIESVVYDADLRRGRDWVQAAGDPPPHGGLNATDYRPRIVRQTDIGSAGTR